MAETKKRRPGKTYCAAGGPGAVNCANKTGTPGITMHCFPKDETLRQKWTPFVRIHRKDFVSTKSSALCSAHFDETCFHSKSIAAFDASGNPVNQNRRLILGSIPSKDTVVPYTSPLTSRKRRMIKRDALFGSDGATSVKRRKILPITETPCTSTTEPAMTEYARPDTSSGGPAGIETPGSSSTCFDVDVTPVSVSTEAQGREAETAFSSLSIVRPGSMALVNDIKKLSADAQTSCLEGFHSTLNHWHPKMVCFSWLGTFCRHILASLHFNENVQRQTKISVDGEEYLKVTYPKFKLGDEVVREVTVPPTYGEEQDQLQASTVLSEAPPKKKRKKPTCAKCGKPKKGHKAALCIDQS